MFKVTTVAAEVAGNVRFSSDVFELCRPFAAIHYVVFFKFFFAFSFPFFNLFFLSKGNQSIAARHTVNRKHHANVIGFRTFDGVPIYVCCTAPVRLAGRVHTPTTQKSRNQ